MGNCESPESLKSEIFFTRHRWFFSPAPQGRLLRAGMFDTRLRGGPVCDILLGFVRFLLFVLADGSWSGFG
jgi:hypothetical protein